MVIRHCIKELLAKKSEKLGHEIHSRYILSVIFEMNGEDNNNYY